MVLKSVSTQLMLIMALIMVLRKGPTWGKPSHQLRKMHPVGMSRMRQAGRPDLPRTSEQTGPALVLFRLRTRRTASRTKRRTDRGTLSRVPVQIWRQIRCSWRTTWRKSRQVNSGQSRIAGLNNERPDQEHGTRYSYFEQGNWHRALWAIWKGEKKKQHRHSRDSWNNQHLWHGQGPRNPPSDWLRHSSTNWDNATRKTAKKHNPNKQDPRPGIPGGPGPE